MRGRRGGRSEVRRPDAIIRPLLARSSSRDRAGEAAWVNRAGKEELLAARQPRRLALVILAAGKGKRMKSDRPKVLHSVCGRPSLWHVLRAGLGARPSRVVIVVSQGRQLVEEAVRAWGSKPEPVFVDQGEPLGTGHALMVSERAIGDVDEVLVLPGDDPLATAEDVRAVLGALRRAKAAAAIGTTFVDDPTGYGRVIRRGDQLVEIVQEHDASAEIRRINEVSTLVYAFRRDELFRTLPLVGRDNRQHEYYLPDVISILRHKGERVAAVPVDFGGAMGLNTRRGLAKVFRVMRGRIIDAHMANGVTFVDPDTAYVDVDVRIGRDTIVQPMSYLEGATRIGAGCAIGPEVLIADSTVGDQAEVTFSVVRGSKIGPRVSVGPFASVRPGTVLEEGAKVGTFVEIKASRVGKGSKVPHLSYVGDAVIGKGANLGAGTVTVNYDGFAKHRTVIGDEAHVGSDTMLIAPVKVGKRAWTGAGSAITKDVPAGALAVERAEQRVVRGYDERKRAGRAGGGRTAARKRGVGGRGGGRSRG
jgi:bifunctional UDP-N-acetylglucosamine pyrophosphorylase/glucosamine-1-phosphate N-acetyltransferase